MDKLDLFMKTVAGSETVVLATSACGRVTMRVVSPVVYAGGILIYTGSDSVKYAQLAENPRCCVGAGTLFAEAEARFPGATMLECNAELRAAYEAKFPGAFAEEIEFGGRAADFILLEPKRVYGWTFPDGTVGGEGIPTVPFELELS